MPITTDSELRSAAQWYPCPPNYDADDGLDEEPDYQTVTWAFIGLTLQEEMEIVRALIWHEATRSLLTGETRLINGIVTKTQASRALALGHQASRALVTRDHRTIALQE